MWGRGNCVLGFLVFFSGRSWVILQKTFPQGFSKWNVDGKITPACCWNPFDKPMHYRLFDFWFASCCFARSADASGMTPRCWCTRATQQKKIAQGWEIAPFLFAPRPACKSGWWAGPWTSWYYWACDAIVIILWYCAIVLLWYYCGASVILLWYYCGANVILLW